MEIDKAQLVSQMYVNAKNDAKIMSGSKSVPILMKKNAQIHNFL